METGGHLAVQPERRKSAVNKRNWGASAPQTIMGNKSIFYLIAVSIFVIPLSGVIPIRGGDIWFSQFLALISVFILGISLRLWSFNKWLSLMNTCGWFSAVFVSGHHPKSMFEMFTLSFSLLAIPLIARLHSRQREIVVKVLLVMVGIQAMWVVLQYFHLDPIFEYRRFDGVKFVNMDDTVGFSASHNQIGLYFASTLPLVLAYFPWIIPFCVFGLWNSTTSFAWVGSFIGVMFYTSQWNREIVKVVLGFSLICSWVFWGGYDGLNKQVFYERFGLWKQTISQVYHGQAEMRKNDNKNVITCNPLFGFGLGNFMRISPHTQEWWFLDSSTGAMEKQGHVYAHAHNDYVEWFFETGYLGLVIMIGTLFSYLNRFLMANKTKLLMAVSAGIVAHCVTALGIFTVHTAVSGMLLVLLIGLFEGEIRGTSSGVV